MKKLLTSAIFLRSLQYYKPEKNAIIIVFALEILGILFALVTPWPAKLIVDGILQQSTAIDTQYSKLFVNYWLGWLQPEGQITVLCLAMALLSIAAAFLGYLSAKIALKSSLMAVLRLRKDLFEALQYLPLRFHDSVPSADSIYRVAYDAQVIQTLYTGVALPLFRSVLTLIGAFLIMLTLSPVLTLISCMVVPPVIWCLSYYSKSIKSYSVHRSEMESSLLRLAQEVIPSIRHVRVHVKEQEEVNRFVASAKDSLQSNYLLTKTKLKSSLWVTTVVAIGTVGLYFVGSIQVLYSTLTLGSVIVFASYLAQLYSPVQSLSAIVGTMSNVDASLDRSFHILDSLDKDLALVTYKPPLPVAYGSIAFENVTFSYDQKTNIIKNFNLDIKAGEFIAIVGPSGHGKSTLLSLLAGFYEPISGKVLVEGNDISLYSASSLRSSMSLVMQDPILFYGTISENISYGKSDATIDQIVIAAEKAEAHEFISKLPLGYQTVVGEGGIRLSGGQRQRLSIARSFLRSTPILLLDEPTSSLDAATEAKIASTIQRLAVGRTTILVTHRISLSDCASRVVVLRDGMIVEEGSPKELTRMSGSYAQLRDAGLNAKWM